MTGQDNPFGALDKLLFSATQVKHSNEKQASEEPEARPAQTSPAAEKGEETDHTAQSSNAELQSREPANAQDREDATSQSRKRAKVRHGETAEPQLREAAKQPDRKTASLQPQGRKSLNHGLSIYEDQLFSLKEIQLERQKVWGQRYSLGDLAKEALDLFISQERNS